MKPRQALIDNIFEARLQLETIEELLLDPEYTEGKFRSAMEHAYHHVNFAWNIRNASDVAVRECSPKNFNRWSKYPRKTIREYRV